MYNFTFKAVWISTKANDLCDALSQGNLAYYKDHAPNAQSVACPPQTDIMFLGDTPHSIAQNINTTNFKD